MAAMTEVERDLLDARIMHNNRKIDKFLTNLEIPFKQRLIVYLATPSVCRNCYSAPPTFPLSETEYGQIDWKREFPYFKKDQTVNLVTMIDHLTKGIKTYFPAHWSDDMLFLFVKDCVDNAIHEFDFVV